MSSTETEELRVSTLELFFDLVFVFTLTQLTGLLSHHPTAETAARVVLIFVVLFWMYGGYAWLTNQVPPDRPARRLLVILGMGAFFVCALAVPEAFDGGGVAFGLGYLLVILVHSGLWLQVYGASVTVRFGAFNVVSALCVIAAGLLDGAAAYGLWVAAIAIQFITPRIAGRAAPQFPLRSGHFVERHGLLLILPIYPCFQDAAGLVRVTERPIENLDGVRAQQALEFHAEIRRAVKEHESDEAYRRDRYLIRPVVGTFQPTSQSARPEENGVEMLRHYGGEDQDGDGTVPRVSATPIEMGNDPAGMYAAERHASLQNFDPVLQQLHGVLSGLDLDLSIYYAVNTRVALDVEDAFLTSEPVSAAVRPEDPGVPLTGTLTGEHGDVVGRRDLPPGDEEWRSIAFDPQPPGIYRLTVRGEHGVDPVTDVVGVFGPDEG